MRSILLFIIIAVAIPFLFKRPWLGVLMWVLVSVMNPHRLTFGFTYAFQFAAIIAVITMVSGLFSKEPKHFPLTSLTASLLALVVWMNITALFALNQESGMFIQWGRVMKMFLMTFVSIWLLYSRRHVHLLIWVVAVSLGYYGIKGGIWTILTGGGERVFGPPNSVIEDNNALAVALVMTIPLLSYLRLYTQQWWLRWGLLGAMLLCGVSALGSYSRGAVLAIVAMAAMLWFKSRQKLGLGLAIILLVPAGIAFMPAKWMERVETIGSYQEDASASGRLLAWETMLNIAKDRPLVGGGFDLATQEVYERYSPDPSLGVFVAHSIYFQSLGEHGFVGLVLYLLVLFYTWKNASWIVRNTAVREEFRWAHDLAIAIQVSMSGFIAGGAFLNLLYFDVPYYLMVALVVTRALIERELRSQPSLVTPEIGARTAPQLTAAAATKAKS